MGMTASLMSVSDHSIEALSSQDEQEWWFEGSPPKMVTSKIRKPGWLERVFGGRQEERAHPLYEFPPGSAEGRTVDLDKAWHGIHFLLTGEVWTGAFPKGFLIAGGRDMGSSESVRSFTAAETRQISNEIEAVSADDLRKSYVPQRFVQNDIYPALEWQDEDFEGYLLPYFQDLKAFLKMCAENDCGFVLTVC